MVTVKVKWNIAYVWAWQLWDAFAPGIFLSDIPMLIDCEVKWKQLSHVWLFVTP